jgi:octanoyl-[GcvH]:protein N-octanoyltransferase
VKALLSTVSSDNVKVTPRRVSFVTDRFPGRPAFDTAVSRAVLERVAAGKLPETFRLTRPDRVLAFGRQDGAAPGFPEAVLAAERQGFASVLRLAGGRAAVFHEGTLSFAWAMSETDPTSRTFARFEEIADILRSGLERLGVNAVVGEVPGEYCPGRFSISAGGQRKLVGVGQRLIAGAAHVGGVIVVERTDVLRAVLIPVYEALGLKWNPDTAGSVRDEVGASMSKVEDAVRSELVERFELVEDHLDNETLELAGKLESAHRPHST